MERVMLHKWVYFGLVVLVLLLLWFGLLRDKSVLLVIDMQRAIHQPAILLAKTNISEKSQQQILKRYAHFLPEVIQSYGNTHHVTIVAGSIAASGNQADITNVIISQTLERVKHES